MPVLYNSFKALSHLCFCVHLHVASAAASGTKKRRDNNIVLYYVNKLFLLRRKYVTA